MSRPPTPRPPRPPRARIAAAKVASDGLDAIESLGEEDVRDAGKPMRGDGDADQEFIITQLAERLERGRVTDARRAARRVRSPLERLLMRRPELVEEAAKTLEDGDSAAIRALAARLTSKAQLAVTLPTARSATDRLRRDLDEYLNTLPGGSGGRR